MHLPGNAGSSPPEALRVVVVVFEKEDERGERQNGYCQRIEEGDEQTRLWKKGKKSREKLVGEKIIIISCS